MIQRMNIVDKLHQQFVTDKIELLRGGFENQNGPLVVELDTTEVCNLACPGCISEDLVSNKTSFSNERLLEIGKEFYECGVKAVVLIGGGAQLYGLCHELGMQLGLPVRAAPNAEQAAIYGAMEEVQRRKAAQPRRAFAGPRTFAPAQRRA